VKAAGRLAYYAGQFDTLEINATFYRLPTQTMLDAWNRTLPVSFHLVVKGPRTVTHRGSLADSIEPLAVFWERVRQLRTLRVILWQFPPSLRADAAGLDRFLRTLPSQVRHAVELRHASWWDRAEQVSDVLAGHQAAWVSVSYPGLPESVQPTTDFLYVRFHGLGKQLYRYDYSRLELERWAARLKPHLDGRALYAFFNNTYQAHAPLNALVFRELLQTLD